MSKPKYYLTTPVYDADWSRRSVPYTAVLSDAIARHKRMCGFDVAHFLGADIHGMSLKNPEERKALRKRLLQRNDEKFEEFLKLVDVPHAFPEDFLRRTYPCR